MKTLRLYHRDPDIRVGMSPCTDWGHKTCQNSWVEIGNASQPQIRIELAHGKPEQLAEIFDAIADEIRREGHKVEQTSPV